MNIIDLVFLIILLWSAYKGFRKGFILQLSTLAALLLGIFGAIKFSDFTATLLTENFEISNQYIQIIAFAVTFIAIVIAVHLVAKLIEKLIQAIALGFINRLLGVVFGVAKIAFIISIILVLVNKANDKYNLYPSIAEKAGMRIVNKYKRPVLNRTEKDKSAYAEIIFHLKEKK